MSSNQKPRRTNNIFAVFGSLGVLGGLASWLIVKRKSRQQVEQLYAEIAQLKKEKIGEGLGDNATTATKCSWEFQPPLVIEKGISERIFIVVDKLEKIETEVSANADQIVLKVIPQQTIYVHFYWSPLRDRFEETDVQLKQESSLGYWDFLGGTTRITLKLQWVQALYDRLSDTLTIIFQLATSLVPSFMSVGSWLSGQNILGKLFGDNANMTIKSLPGNRFEIIKENVLAEVAENMEKEPTAKDTIFGFISYLKYAHMASPELLNAMLFQLPKTNPFMKTLQKLHSLTKTSCRLVLAESISVEKPSNS